MDSPERDARLATLREAVYEKPLEPDEFARRLALALAEEDELARAAELIAWFKRRYPTAKDRLDYIRARHVEWMRSASKRQG